MIEVTKEMVRLVYDRIDFVGHGDDGIAEGLADVFALVAHVPGRQEYRAESGGHPMTAALATVAAKLSDIEALVLSGYGEGSKTVDTIVAETGLVPAAVSSIIARLAWNDRNRARDLLDAWEALAHPPAEPVRAADPAPQPEPAGDAIAELIARAVATEVPKLVRAADRISDLVDQLEKELADHERTAALRVEQEKLAARLAEIQQELGVKQTTTPADDGKVIRAWAAENGVACPARGRVPAAVRQRYQAAMDSGSNPGGAS